ncbi:MAG TPA: cupin-like domain-containing protein [Blastocatellia bacterium]|nr:cupin-like domain-containing protein [Blastocatellia bacterium]
MATQEITRLPRLDEAEFHRNFSGRLPVLLPACVRGSRACATWSPEYLESVIGDKTVQVNYCARALEKTTEGAAQAPAQYFEVTFREAADLIRGSADVVYFVMGQPIQRVFPELMDDLDFDELVLRAAPLFSINLWFAAAGHLTPLHYDIFDNFLNQIVGRKRVTLFSPDDIPYLYTDAQDDAGNPVTVNPFDPDYDKFPRFRHATPMEFILEPGDTLYQPAGWSHQIESLDTTVSVNFFFGEKWSPNGNG